MDPLYYYLQYHVLVCKSCQYAVQPHRIIAHLRSDQHKLSLQQSKEIADRYKDYELADPCIEHIGPETITTPINHLPIYRDGLQCNYCSYICRAIEVMKRHQRQSHSIRIGRGRRSGPVGWSTTWCQCFFISAGQYYFQDAKIDNSNSIIGQHYFKVQQTNQLANLPTDTTERLLQLVHQQLDQKQKVIEEKKQVIKDSDNLTEVSSWLERTQWIRHLAGQNRVAMAQLVNRPRDEELGLQYVEKSLNRLVEKSRQTIIQVKLIFLLMICVVTESGNALY